jgi:hypothetical protein
MVYVRTAFTPFAAMPAKSSATDSTLGKSLVSSSGRKVPYVTPRTCSLASPS